MTALELSEVQLSFGPAVILERVSFAVQPGEFVCLTGPSGCGKSTLLRLVGDLLKPSGGRILIQGQPAETAWAKLAYVFQSPRLAFWKNAVDNVVMGMRLRGLQLSKDEMRQRALEYLRLVGLDKDGHKFPAMLSGGERQRVSLARAWAVEPDIILMDEPFSALDLRTKSFLREELINIWQRTAKTILFVTHDVAEAATLGDRILVFSPKPTRVSRVVEVAAPRPRGPEAIKEVVQEVTDLIHQGDELVATA